MGESDTPNILLYEASEGSLGVLSQVVDTPEIYRSVMKHAYELCFMNNGDELPPEQTVPATYDDLLSYYNQHHHRDIDRNLIRDSLRMLVESTIEIQTSTSYSSYDDHYESLQKARDPNSSTEDEFLKFLYKKGLRLPDKAQPNVDRMYVRPDFFYKPNIMIFCDGTPHDDPRIKQDDHEKRSALKNAGYQVLSWYYREPLADFVVSRPDIFKPVK